MALFGLKTGNNIIKSKGQMVKEMTIKIGELEREREWLKQRLAYLMVAVNALGIHSNLTAEEAKEVVNKFIKEKEVDMQSQIDVAKEKFKSDIANGKMPEGFKVINNAEQ